MTENQIYIVSLNARRAVRYNGKMHHMSIKSAVKRFAEDAIAISYCGTGHIAGDVLKRVSAGEMHISMTQRDLIAAAK